MTDNITLYQDFLPRYSTEREDVEPAIREALAEDWLHAIVEMDGFTLYLDHCAFDDGTPRWDYPDKPGSEIRAVRADGEKTTIYLDKGEGWDDLCARLAEFMDGWDTLIMETLSEARHYARKVDAAKKALEEARARQRWAVKAAVQAGSTMYKVSKVTGRSRPAISTMAGSG